MCFRLSWVVIASLSLLTACEGSGATLLTDLRTDLVPGEEFFGVSVTLAQQSGGTVSQNDTLVRFGEAFVDGRRILEESDLEAGAYLVTVELLDAEGAVLATRRTTVEVDGDYAFTTIISRDARTCDEASCAADESCGSGRCASVACSPETMGACPAPQCMSGGECMARATCSIPVCVAGVCLYGAVDGGCADDEWCNPDAGCFPRQAPPPVDGGTDTGTGGCPPGFADCDGDESNGCELPVEDDPVNCGGCGVRCDTAANGAPACVSGSCALDCEPGFGDCDGDLTNGCEADLADNADNCGRCGSICPAGLPVCIDSDCIGSPFPSDGSEGAFEPMTDVVLSAGVHEFDTIAIPAGVTITTDGNGIVELRARGDVTIAGTLAVSGGLGGRSGRNFGTGGGGGGATGTGVVGLDPVLNTCHPPGPGGTGAPGVDVSGCAVGGRVGGGTGGSASGGGGGGYAGGQGGGGGGGAGGADSGSTGGSDGACAGGGGEPGMGAYSGASGGQFGCCNVCGGGGGAIGATAIADLAMSTTFRPGSGGGAGGGGNGGTGNFNGGGGGGGGGAVRVSSNSRIVLETTGRILARGGGGGGAGGTSAGGAGGSGGAVYLSAPEMSLMGEIDTSGGAGGAGGSGRGGAGGIGRIRLSVLPSRCSLAATTVPAVATGCVETDVAESVYIGVWPD